MQVEFQTSDKGEAQIYWDNNDKGFNEKNSRRVQFNPAQEKYALVLPDLRTIKNLRFDPDRKSVSVKIKGITFKQENFNPIRFQSPEKLKKLLHPLHDIGSVRAELDGVMLISNGNDPHLALDMHLIETSDKSKGRLTGYIIGWSLVLLLSLLLTGLIRLLPKITMPSALIFLKKYILRLKTVEFVAALLMIIAVIYYLGLWIWTMATTSLWTDEIYTIANFSSQGLWTVLTDYHAPNNHIFFNLLNSLTPYSDSYHPLRARLWSFVAMSGTIVFTLVFFFRRRAFLAGALCLCLLGASWNHLNFMLQARGYGILAFCALATSLTLISYQHSQKVFFLFALTLLSFIGTWTVPTYGFFAGALLLMLFFFERDRKTLIAVLTFGVAILMIYLPIARQIIEVSTNYAGRWGEEYAEISAVFHTIQYYLFPTLDLRLIFFIFCCFLCLPFLLWRIEDYEGRAYQIIVLSAILFFTACLLLKTPAQRSVAFIIFPVGVVIVGIVTKIYNYRKLKYLRPVLCISLLILFHPIIEDKIATLKKWFAPTENWMGSAELIKAVFPENKHIYCNFRANLLQKYLIGNYQYDDDDSELDHKKFINSEIIFVDSHPWKKKRFDSGEFTSDAIEILIPQTRGHGKYQKIAYVSPQNSDIKKAFVSNENRFKNNISVENGLIHWSMINSSLNYINKSVLTIKLSGEIDYYSLNIHTHNMVADDIVAVDLKQQDKVFRLGKKQIRHFFVEGRNWKRDKNNFDTLITIGLDNRKIDQIILTLNPFPVHRAFAIEHIWLEKSG
ncbi:hypothetical protein QUF75_00370 [Desulfococcaceae bacterium HSG7]|nr:hypothetical protein [Desulfococcaceae bacterium HSG7]